MKAHRHRAFFLIDTVMGLAIIASVAILLIASVRHEQSAELKLTASRSAIHLAEHALLNLQHGQPMPAVTGDTHLTIHRATGGTAPAGYVWVTVDATVRGHHRSLVGVVPAGEIPSKGDK